MKNTIIKKDPSQRITPLTPQRDIKELKWLDNVTRLMDTAFPIPGTKYRFGLDPILGLVPVVGDMVSFGISGVLILSMLKYGASRKVIIMMIGNSLIDALFGSIPILGSIFDVGYKANKRNLELLKKHQLEGKYQGSGTGILIGVGIVLFLLFCLIGYGLWRLGEYIIGLF